VRVKGGRTRATGSSSAATTGLAPVVADFAFGIPKGPDSRHKVAGADRNAQPNKKRVSDGGPAEPLDRSPLREHYD